MVIASIIIIVVIFLANKIFVNNESSSSFPTQIGMAAVVFSMTLLVYFNENTNTALKYIVVIIGIVSAIAILYEAFTTKKK